MTTTATAAFNLDLNELIEEAFERAGTELRTGYEFRSARRSLNLMFADWANRGINLWTVEQGEFNLNVGQATYDLPVDTVDKTVQGRPIQVYINRQSGATAPGNDVQYPTVTVWPVPNVSDTYKLVYWRLRRILDSGNGVNTQDIPFRFLPCLVSGLAYYVAMKLPSALERLPALKQMYDQDWQLAMEEDREKASLRMVPREMFI
jgi:hypothetical protein